MDETRAKKIKALQDWHKEEYHGFEMSAEEAEKLLDMAEEWGANIFREAYDLVVEGGTRECGHYININQYEIQVVKKETKNEGLPND
ncbi:MAG: hypothetical protein MJ053_07070 [Elusimicrobiaceae bacterium]|nr:hypothetical protein [Elusimicrobiaceae bacterium]